MDTTDRLITKVELQGEGNVTKGLSRIAGALGSLAAIGGAAGFLVSSAKAAMEAEDALTRYAAVAKLAGNALPVDQAAAFAAEQQKVTIYTDEAVLAIETMMAAAHASGPQIKSLTQAVEDAAAGTGRSLEEVGGAVQRALATGQLRGLKAYGVAVDEARFKTDRAGAIVAALEDRFGGLAKAMGETTFGKITRMVNQFGELQEVLGRGIIPAINIMLPHLTAIAEAFVKLDESTHGWSTRVILLLGGTAGLIKLVMVVKELAQGLKEMAIGEALVEAFSGWKGLAKLAVGMAAAAGAMALINKLSGGGAAPGTAGPPGLTPPPLPGAGGGFAAATRTFLGGGAIGRIGMAASELPDIRARANNAPVTVRIEGDTTFEQVVNKVLAQLTRHGVIRPATG